MYHWILALVVIVSAHHVNAFTVGEAQTCADRLLDAYNQKTYPRTLLALEAIVATAFGPAYHDFSEKETALAHTASEDYLRSSFTDPVSPYQFHDLIVNRVEPLQNGGYRAFGEVTIISPNEHERYSFLALVTEQGCKIRQVRIADVRSLINQLKQALARDSRVRRIFKP